MAFKKGNDIRVSIGEELIGGQTGASMNKESDTTDTTTKDSGMWAEPEVSGLSWSVDCDGLVVVGDAALKALNKAWREAQLVDIKYGTAEAYEHGKALISSLSENAPNKEKCTYSVSFQGVGELQDHPQPAE
ncbi:phage tail tube protein [Paraclostridium dentum]|uniref:phage tail tube protein n=1 Tax=Paraclostridium dentum TaxID=2662455 RepID=UPI00051D182F|nr:phage tail tube protein [Paraclostridium dentum]KGJ49703.1 hypothetical protein KD33_07010 [Clostridium sp. NCR]